MFVLCGVFKKNLPVHSFNALIIPILRDCLPNYFLVGDFRCGALLFMVIHVIYKYKNK